MGFKCAAFSLLMVVPSTLGAQGLDQVAQRLTIMAYESDISTNITYKRAEGHEMKLDVITPGQSAIFCGGENGPKSQLKLVPSRGACTSPSHVYASEVRPTFIYIHGGGWNGGDKESEWLKPLPFLASGMAVVQVEYRVARISHAPAAVEDCRCALRWVYQHATEYGFDLDKIVVAGTSAGGHLAMMTGLLPVNNEFDNECTGTGVEKLKVSAIVDIAGITDVTDLLRGPHQKTWALMWMGYQPDPMGLAKRLSPLSYVGKDSPPTIIIHGDADPTVPYQQGVSLYEALKQAGVPTQLVTIPHGDHGGWPRKENLRFEEAIFAFLRQNGILEN